MDDGRTDSSSDTMSLTASVNNKIMTSRGRSMEINTFTVLKDDIMNYRPLTEFQKMSIEHLTDQQKTELILLYDKMIINVNVLFSD